MNKNVGIVIVAVLLLGMGLITYNEYTNPGIQPFTSAQAEKKTTPLAQTPPSSEEKLSGEVTIPAPVTEDGTPAPNTSNAPAVPTPPEEAPTPEKAADAVVEQTVPTAPLIPESVQEATAAPSPVSTSTPETKKAEQALPTKPAQSTAKAKEKPVEKPAAKAVEKAAEKVPTQKAANAQKVIKRITVSTIGDGVTVRLDSSEFPKYKETRYSSPDRLVLDLAGTWKLRAPGVPKNAFVSNVRIGQHKDSTRIVIDMHKFPNSIRYLKYGEHGLDVRLR